MTHDDYQQMRGMYADIDELCRTVEEAGSTAASEESLRRLVGLLHDQQREPEQIRSFLRHLGVAEAAVGRFVGDASPEGDKEHGSGIA